MALANTYPLEHNWTKLMHGNLSNPRFEPESWFRSDWDSSQESSDSDDSLITLASWHDHRSIDFDTLYPDRPRLGEVKKQLAAHRADSKVEDDIPKPPGDVDAEMPDAQNTTTQQTPSPPSYAMWSYDTHVLGPITQLYNTKKGSDRALSVLAALDLGWDGWILETFRSKIEASVRIHEFPRVVKMYGSHGELLSSKIVEKNGECCTFQGGREEQGRDVGTGDGMRWVGTMCAVLNNVPSVGEGEGDGEGSGRQANVKIVQGDGRIVVRSLRKIEEGEIIYRE